MLCFAKSHDFAATHGSNIVIDGTTERDIFVKRRRIRELNYESMSEPELQVPLSSVSLPEDIGSSASDSHDFAATHGSNIVIDGTTERDIFVKRRRIRELNYESMSEPELQVPLSSVSLPEDIGSSASDVGKSVHSLCVADNVPNDPCTSEISLSGGI
uniref:Uncharacterized protein n=1 Tax=Tanacetum cinerariifolium TaxID=118510 RepID=A0A6L2KXC4_TANCI|nr:hypothetical protein [Tanacetum cinerariifolium]